MQQSKHLIKSGLKKIIVKAFSMNNKGQYRQLKLDDILNNLESSETVRQAR